MYYLLFSFRYLMLRTEDGSLILWRDIIPVTALSAVIFAPLMVVGAPNFFDPSGFLGRVGSITGNLAGFYIAGLVAVAAFSMERASLDEIITTGKVSPDRYDASARRFLTRREYVCYIFGYLTILSLIFSVMTVVFTSIGQPIGKSLDGLAPVVFGYHFHIAKTVKYGGICLSLMPLSHLLITTGYGLYYLIEKVYAKAPKLKQKQPTAPRVRSIDTKSGKDAP